MSQRIEHPSLETPPAGSLRFNTDSSKMEIYNGEQWWEIDSTSPEEQTGSGEGNGGSGGSARGVWFGAESPSMTNRIQYITIQTTGDAIDFGDMTDQRTELGAFGSRTRGFSIGGFFGSQPTEYTNTIDMITFASTGNATDFADAAYQRGQRASCASRTRAVTGGGAFGGNQTFNNIEYFTMASQADGLDFGDLSITTRGVAACSSQTRGIFFLGDNAGSSKVNTIEYVTISTTGNSADFGDALTNARYSSGCSNSTTGLKFGGTSDDFNNSIDSILISTLGNAVDFGDMIDNPATNFGPTGCSSKTRGVVAGGTTPSLTDRISYVDIATKGNAMDFGDLLEANQYAAGASNGHGGLG